MPHAKTAAVLLQTATVILENPDTKQQVKKRVLHDASFQRTYISERIRKFVNLSTEAVEDANISIVSIQAISKSIDRVSLVAKTNNHENILTKALCLPMFAYIESKYRISEGTVWKIS